MAGQHDDGRLEAALAHDAHGFPAIDVGQADIHDHEVDLAGLGGMDALGPVLDRNRLEFLMQRQLLDQRIAQLGIVIHDQYLAGVRHHGPAPRVHGSSYWAKQITPEVEHSGTKEQAGDDSR